MQELQFDSRIKTITYAAFMSPLINACSLAIIEPPRNIGWMSNCTVRKNKSCSIQPLAKEGSKLFWKVFVSLRKNRMFAMR